MLNFCLGFDVGPEDGINGDRTKSALIELDFSQQQIYYRVRSDIEFIDLTDFSDTRIQARSTESQKLSELNPYLMPFILFSATLLLFFSYCERQKVFQFEVIH